MEQVIVILIFAFCAAVCVRIFAGSYLMTAESRELTGALLAAENAAESYKAFSGNLEKVAEILNGETFDDGNTSVVAYYNKNWQSCIREEAVYNLKITRRSGETGLTDFAGCDIIVSAETGGEIFSLPAAARVALRGGGVNE